MLRSQTPSPDTAGRLAPVADGRVCVVHCMDYRIQATADRLMGALGVGRGRFDRVSVAGGAGNADQTRRHLDLSIRLHNAASLVLTAHEDCGAGATRDDLTRALALARGSHPERHIRGFWINLDGTWEEFPV
ncbi:hypothetical protein HN371_03795 [Candidatus Poribacteria bacterium]|nr:hypothetical protein [Candidatus Poribacteria bacterium]MBT5536606.1 hypothetical protein [Candidatus Poribacteria bacterium]MBT5712675.1 hypothetical protein [Candidatus Poribacteria bacterium]MBT7098264.1 hypothetical protein [Candidatus Poribacteria bacterium]MBT7804605.1 hypothetical protein [Candidatus Poribacteria bacterium]